MSDNQVQINKILSHLVISELNEMQLAAIKANEENKDIILLSATGSGKTLAFLLPLVQALKPENKHPQALIIVPSRELAIQIDDVFRKMQTGFKVTLCYGGHKREIEETNLIQVCKLTQEMELCQHLFPVLQIVILQLKSQIIKKIL